MTDTIETIAGSVVQHGRHNQRIYVMHCDTSQIDCLIPTIDHLAVEKSYGKIFAKIPATHWQPFKSAGYIKEAVIPGFFNGVTGGLFVAKFFSAHRQKTEESTWASPLKAVATQPPITSMETASMKTCGPGEAVALADLYRQVFSSYAFPIDQPGYIEQMMRENTHYVAVYHQGTLAAAAALEIDVQSANCEMTDFATRPQFRGKGLAGKLLRQLEKKAGDLRIKTAYTIARADSAAMNSVFYKTGYQYAGRLVNNTQIGGRIRNMNVWYKRLATAETTDY